MQDRCVPALSLGKKNRHRERVPLRTERRHVGQLFEDHWPSKKNIVYLYICVIYRRASHAGPSAPLCFARIMVSEFCANTE